MMLFFFGHGYITWEINGQKYNLGDSIQSNHTLHFVKEGVHGFDSANLNKKVERIAAMVSTPKVRNDLSLTSVPIYHMSIQLPKIVLRKMEQMRRDFFQQIGCIMKQKSCELSHT